MQLILVNTYVLDPSHIAPSRSDASSNGHFPTNNHNVTTGTPRGFNLQNIPIMPGFPPNFNPSFQNSPFSTFGNHTVQPPQGAWPLSNGTMVNTDEPHQAGPIRRGGGRFGNPRPAGPYDRRQPPRFNGDGRVNPLMLGNGSNPLVSRRGGFGGGAGKWGDGAGAQTVGPKEAVQGRTLKKYDDLDAVEGGVGGELNY